MHNNFTDLGRDFGNLFGFFPKMLDPGGVGGATDTFFGGSLEST